ncbi:MAG: 2-oxo acid dehydrogenase subunit E2 [Gammaproteobacteria bacterium]|nr:2-oxo acid dehydrogenase subunit E2 [Gammaproteobacteria bacterium]
MSEFRMPALGADMEEGTVVQWNVAPGDTVKRGQVVAVVETDKGAIDVEIFEDGVVREIVVQPGTKVAVGTVLARLEAAASAGAAAPASVVHEDARSSVAASRPSAVNPEASAEALEATAPPVRAKVSPAARVRARELGVDVATLTGTGPGGAITVEDVEKAGVTPRRELPGGMRDAIAAAMSRSKREIPHYYLSLATDVTVASDWLVARNASVPVDERVIFAALLIKAVALACRELEGFSGFYREGRFEESPSVHVGVAVALRGGGLVAPAIMDAADKALPALMEDFRQLVMRARAGRLRASELAAPTIILTSLGDSAVDAVFPIIQPPQVAIVGAGAVGMRPWVVDGQVVPRQVISLSLGADHRVTDGRLGAQFLARIASKLAAPETL